MIAWGVVEIYFITEPDLPKDSSCEATILARGMDVVATELAAKSVVLPAHLVVEDTIGHLSIFASHPVEMMLEVITVCSERDNLVFKICALKHLWLPICS
jgi:hypothetical protein